VSAPRGDFNTIYDDAELARLALNYIQLQDVDTAVPPGDPRKSLRSTEF
jgi:hypothetical protein